MARLRTQVIEQFAALVTAAFGLLAALAWNEAIKSLVTTYIKVGQGWIALLIYAVLVTLLALAVTLLIGRVAAKARSADPATKEDRSA